MFWDYAGDPSGVLLDVIDAALKSGTYVQMAPPGTIAMSSPLPTSPLLRPTKRSHTCSLLSGSDQFFPCQSVAKRTLHLVDSLLREFCNLLHQVNLRNRSLIVAVDDAGLGHSLDRAKRNLDRKWRMVAVISAATNLLRTG